MNTRKISNACGPFFGHVSEMGTRRISRTGMALCAVVAAGFAVPAWGQVWDIDDNNDQIDGGTGTWNTIDPTWTADGGVTNSNWISGDVATFEGIAGDVTLGGPIPISGLIFGTGGYSIIGPGIASLDLTSDAEVTTAVGDTSVAVNFGRDGALDPATVLTLSFDGPGNIDFSGDLGANIDVSVNAGGFTASGALNGVAISGGVAELNGQAVSELAVSGGSVTQSMANTISGNVSVTGGTAQLDGAVNADVTVGGGTLVQTENGTITDTLTLNSGSLTAGGTIGALTTNGGTANVTGSIDNNVAVNGGTVRLNTGGTVAGNVTIAAGGRFDLNGGTVAGTITNTDGTLGIKDQLPAGLAVDGNDTLRIIGPTTANGADFSKSGTSTLDVADGDLSNLGALTNGGTGTITVAANRSLAATSISNTAGGTINALGEITGDLTNDGSVTSADRLIGDLTNNETVTAKGAIVGAVTNNKMFTVTDSLDIGGAFLNSDMLVVSGGILTVSGDLTSSETGEITLADTTGVNAKLVNNGNIAINGTAAFNGEFTNTGTVTGTVDAKTGSVDNQNSLANIMVDAGVGFQNAVGATAQTVTNKSDLATNSGKITALVNAGGTFANDGEIGSVVVNSGQVDNAKGGTTGTVTGNFVVNDGVGLNPGTVSGNMIVNGGSGTNSGTVTGNLDVAGGTGLNTGTVMSDMSVGSGAATNSNAVMGSVLVSGGTGNNSGAVGKDFVISGGIGQNSGAVAENLNVSGGAFTNASGGEIGGNATITSGETSNLGTIKGNLDATGGTITHSGDIEGLAAIGSAVAFTMTGTVGQSLINEGTSLAEGSVGGNIDNKNSLTVTGPLAGSGDFTNSGTTIVNGAFDILGNASNTNALSVSGGGQMSTGGLTNSGQITNAGTISGVLDNTGAINSSNGTFGTVSNAGGGTITLGGDMTVTDTLNNTGTLLAPGNKSLNVGTMSNVGTIDFSGNGTGDTLTINGAVAGSGTIIAEVDLDQPIGTADTVTVVGTNAADLSFSFQDVSQGAPSFLANDVLVLANVGAGANIADIAGANTLPSDLGVQYGFAIKGDDLVIVSDAKAVFGGVFDSVAAMQTILETIVNRPTSPFVTGLGAQIEDKECGIGSWARATGGNVDTTLSSRNNIGLIESSFDVTYAGVQVGVDYGCSYFEPGNWNLSGGFMLGYNRGSAQQAIVQGNVAAFNTDTDFTQSFAGAYMVATKAYETGAFSGDLQVRVEESDFSITSIDAGATAPSEFDAANFKMDTVVLSGSASYAVPLKNDLTLIPAIGFAVAKSSSGELRANVGAATDRVVPDDHVSTIGFISSTLSRTNILGELSYSRQFVTATYYKDFSDNRTGQYFGVGGNQPLSTDGIDGFGEVSAGYQFSKLLEGQIGNAKQVTANIRADYKFGQDLSALSLTADARIQF